MASGRVGGTRSKISGQIGQEVYQIRKNPDGTYSQIVNAKGEISVNYTTPRLQAQRMCTSMVEAMMRDLKEVASISMQSAANKSKSLNAFSSYNLQLVARDCKANWFANNQFVYPELNRFDIKQRDLGGLYMLSSGSLQFNVFAGHAEYENPSGGLVNYPNATHTPEGVYFRLPNYGCTISEFLRANRMTRLDYVVCCFFGSYAEDVPEAYIVAAPKGYEDLLLCRLDAINDVSISEIITRAARVIPHENLYSVQNDLFYSKDSKASPCSMLSCDLLRYNRVRLRELETKNEKAVGLKR